MSKKNENYLDFVPKHADHMRYSLTEDDMVELEWDHKGIYARLAQKVFHKPKTSYVLLDAYGSFIWQQIDGQKTIYEICDAVERHFGEEKNSHAIRLVKFIKILQNNRFVVVGR